MWKNRIRCGILKAQSKKETEVMIGRVISEKRKELGLTQAQLGERLGVTAPAVNRWEKNLSYPDATLLAPLARCLHTDLNELFSFYTELSEEEIKRIGRNFTYRLTCDGGESAIEHIEKVFQENPSDGRLYCHIAELLDGYISLTDETALMDRVIHYYECALELMPEKAEQIYFRLMHAYAKAGEEEKAEKAWSHLNDKTAEEKEENAWSYLHDEYDADKSWGHAEMLSYLKRYDIAAQEKEKNIYRKIKMLMEYLYSLSGDLSAQGDEALAEMAKEKAVELKKLFGIRTIHDVLLEWTVARAEIQKEDDAKERIDALLEEARAGKVSICPLFKDITEEQVYGKE